MRLVRSAFSIRPLEIAFKSRFANHRHVSSGSYLGSHLGDSSKNPFAIGQKTATIWRKEHFDDPSAMPTICKHPRVRIVSRHEDTEFVECLECGEVFDSEEFRDMEIEETAEPEDVTEEN